MTIIQKYVDPTSGSDSSGDGSSGNPWKTLTHAIAAVGGSPGAPGDTALVNLVGNATEQVEISRHDWTVFGNQSMVVDLGGHTLTGASGGQAPLLAVACETAWLFQNGVIAPASGQWAVEVDEGSNISFGAGLTFDLPSGTAGGVFSNASSEAVFYDSVTASGACAGYIMCAAYDAHILYEASTIALAGGLSFYALFNLLANGKIEFSTAESFTGTFTFSGYKFNTDGLSGSQIVAPSGITWPSGARDL